MITYLVHTIDAFLPLALCLGILGALLQIRSGRRSPAPLLWAVLLGLAAGGVLYGAAAGEQLTAVRTVLRGALVGTALLALVAAIFLPVRKPLARKGASAAAGLFLAALAGQGLFALRDRIYYEGLSSASVLNTELILNLGGILAALVLLIALGALVWRLTLLPGRWAVVSLLAMVAAVLSLLWSAEAVLGLMRLQLLELTSGRLSFVAVVTDFASRRTYLLLALILLLAVLFLRRALATYGVTAPPEQRAVRRKERSLRLAALRRFTYASAAVVLLAGAFLYHDLYASRPPRVSTPTTVRPAEDGTIHVRVADVADGRLHRFACVMQNGKVIRFFLMNKLRDQVKIGVAFDACLLCADTAYIQEGDDLVCLACKTRIFVPSLGKAGGCNPIPLGHQVKGDEILISPADLAAEAARFNEVRDIEGNDPVTGETVINTKAPYQYKYDGKTYFFGSEKSWKRFRETPEKYLESGSAGGSRPCCTGHREG